MSALGVCLAEVEISPAVPADGQWQRHKIVIAAAVAAIFGPGAVIRDVSEASGAAAGAWVRQGRMDQFSCHDLAAPLIRYAPDWGLDKR